MHGLKGPKFFFGEVGIKFLPTFKYKLCGCQCSILHSTHKVLLQVKDACHILVLLIRGLNIWGGCSYNRLKQWMCEGKRRIMETQRFHHAKNITIKKSSNRRNQNPSKILLLLLLLLL